MRKDIYSPYKAIHHIDRLRQKQPIHVQWHITNRCNLDCYFCANNKKDKFDESMEMPIQDLFRIAAELKDMDILAIELTGGEPTQHDDFNLIVQTLADLGFELGLKTNGTRPDILMSSADKFAWIRISIDAWNPCTYQQIKSNVMPDFSYVKHLKNTVIGASFIIVQENYLDIVGFATWAKNQGFDNCRFSYNHDVLSSYYKSFNLDMLTLLDIAQDLETPNFAVFTLKERLKAWNIKKYARCCYSDLTFVISASGEMYRCCEYTNKSEGNYGKLKANVSCWQLWQNRPKLNPQNCPPCWMDEKNKFAEYLMKENPLHINFL